MTLVTRHTVIRHVRVKNNRSDKGTTGAVTFHGTSPDAITDLAREWIHQEADRLGISTTQAHHGSLTWAFAIIDAAVSHHGDRASTLGTLKLTVSSLEAEMATSCMLTLKAGQRKHATAPTPFTEALAAAILGNGALIARHITDNGPTTLCGWRLQRGRLRALTRHEMRDAALFDPTTSRWKAPEPGVVYTDAFPIPLAP